MNNKTALFLAIEKENIEVIKLLLVNITHKHINIKITKMSPLDFAIHFNKTKAIQILKPFYKK